MKDQFCFLQSDLGWHVCSGTNHKNSDKFVILSYYFLYADDLSTFPSSILNVRKITTWRIWQSVPFWNFVNVSIKVSMSMSMSWYSAPWLRSMMKIENDEVFFTFYRIGFFLSRTVKHFFVDGKWCQKSLNVHFGRVMISKHGLHSTTRSREKKEWNLRPEEPKIARNFRSVFRRVPSFGTSSVGPPSEPPAGDPLETSPRSLQRLPGYPAESLDSQCFSSDWDLPSWRKGGRVRVVGDGTKGRTRRLRGGRGDGLREVLKEGGGGEGRTKGEWDSRTGL